MLKISVPEPLAIRSTCPTGCAWLRHRPGNFSLGTGRKRGTTLFVIVQHIFLVWESVIKHRKNCDRGMGLTCSIAWKNQRIEVLSFLVNFSASTQRLGARSTGILDYPARLCSNHFCVAKANMQPLRSTEGTAMLAWCAWPGVAVTDSQTQIRVHANWQWLTILIYIVRRLRFLHKAFIAS